MSAETFVESPSGRAAVGCALLVLAVPTVGFAKAAWESAGPWFAAVPVALGVGSTLYFYVTSNVEVRVTIDERGMRLSRTRVLFGARTDERIDWDIPLDRLTEALETVTRTPSSHGGWNTKTVLQLPDGRAIAATDLGGDDSSDTAYSRLRASLKKRLGSRFRRETFT